MWSRVVAASRAAHEAGVLVPLETEVAVVPDGPMQFVVRIARSLARKPDAPVPDAATAAAPDGPCDPFGPPYDHPLVVGDVGPAHVALLNKFCVVPHHFLLVTRAFVHQSELLDRADFGAVWTCLRDAPFLVFYNCGEHSGASQPHKHIQLMPRPDELPVEPLLRDLAPDHPSTIAAWTFKHLCVRFAPGLADDAERSADASLEHYRRALELLRVPAGGSYNLLMTREWLLLVPRRRAEAGQISVNSLGFSGTLLVKTPEQAALVRDRGPLSLLRDVGEPSV